MDGLSGNAGGAVRAAAIDGPNAPLPASPDQSAADHSTRKAPYRPVDVLQHKTAETLEARLYPARHCVPHVPRNHDATCGCRPLEPDRDIHAVAVKFVVVDNEVPEVQADAEHDGGIRRLIAIGVEHRLLDLDGRAQGLDRTGEFDHCSIAGKLDQPAPAAPDRGLDPLGTMRLQAKMRAAFIRAHQARVPHDV